MLPFRKIVLSAVAAALTIFALATVAACTTDPAPRAAVTSAPGKPPVRVQGELSDLLFIQIDDRTSDGLSDLWLKWKIKNNSARKSDYNFDWEAVNTKTGVRVDSGTEMETNVLPGQTTTGSTFTMLSSARDIKIRITEFDRTASDGLA